MDKQQAQQLIKETFEAPFDKSRFTGFIKNLLNRIDDAPFTYQGNYIPDAYKQYIKTLERIAKFSDGENSIDILVITLLKETSLERARTMQRNFIAWYLNGSRGGEMKDAALVAYVSPDIEDWRFSLVKMDYKFDLSAVAQAGKTATGLSACLPVLRTQAGGDAQAGKTKVKEEFTPARRWSFLVGKNEKSHTAQSRLVNILADDEHAPTLQEIEKAFDIESVTREFFLKYRELFLSAKEDLDKVVTQASSLRNEFKSKGVDTVNFAKKLLGQIVFLYFLQKKGWFGVGRDAEWGKGSKQFLRELFAKKHGDYKNFFNDILEPLFYEALRIDRSHDDGYYSRFDCKIPFLNGGLFDPIGNYDWVHTDILLPDKLFSNTNKTKEGDIGDGILDVFDRYNFTVKEDEPLEKEVAIDPELLGKAYEKFNAIRPDNFDEYKKALKSGKKGDESKFNKQFGVYYTPREIVHYMCRESLINYLFTELSDCHSGEDRNPVVSREDIEALIHTGEQVSENEARVLSKGKETRTYFHQLPEGIRKNAKQIDDKLADITVCDPAVGSGAFPVGMMSEIVKTRNVLTTFLPVRDRLPASAGQAGTQTGIEDKQDRKSYSFKHRCIEHSLYGVDIDPGAVEIAKLRLWLSLVVDEDDIKQIKPLPNLDYKIVCGNSLLGYPYTPTGLDKIEKLKQLFFNETNPTRKNELRSQIDAAIYSLYKNTEKSLGYKVTVDFKINFSEVFHAPSLPPLNKGGTEGGFDVVIANPPYVRQEAIRHLKPHLATAFGDFFCGTADIYTYFYKCGIDLLKPVGHLCFIAPNKFMRAGYGKNTRILLTTRVTPKLVIDFGDLPIFDATTYPSIILVEKNPPKSPLPKGASLLPPFRKGGQGGIPNTFLAATFTEADQLERLEETLNRIGFPMPVASLKKEGWNLEQPEVLALMEKLKSSGIPLGEYVQGRFYRGVLTGFNDAFVIDSATREKLIAEDPASADLVKPWLRGRDICKWKAEWAGLYVIFTRRGIDIEKYPAIKQYLIQFKKDLMPKKSDSQKQGRKPGSYQWYEIQDNIAYYEEFERPKIIYPNITKTNVFAFDATGILTNQKCFIIPVDDLYLLAILNSKMANQWFRATLPLLRGGFFEPSAIFMEKFPVFQATEAQKAPIIEHTRAILADPDSPEVPRLEAKINQQVYTLYKLTLDEVKIIENEQ